MQSVYSISRLTEENASRIIQWRFRPPFDLYDLNEDDLEGLLTPDFRYHQVLDEKGNLVGYCCFGLDAQVPGGEYQQGEPEVLDIGVGMRPDLVGRGRGKKFVETILDFADETFQPQRFRVTVADFNTRSKRTFQGLGFTARHHFIRELVKVKFIQLERHVKED